MKTRSKGKVIIGISMAAIMLATVLVAMVPTGSAFVVTSDLPTIVQAGTQQTVTITLTGTDNDDFEDGDVIMIMLPEGFTLSAPPTIDIPPTTVTIGEVTGAKKAKVVTIGIETATLGKDILKVTLNMAIAETAFEKATFVLTDSTGPSIDSISTYVTIPPTAAGGYSAKAMDLATGGNILIGQKIWFTGITPGATKISIIGDTSSGSKTSGEVFSTAVTSQGFAIFDTSVMKITGTYYISDGTITPAILLAGDPTMALSTEVGTKTVSSVSLGTPFKIIFTNNLDPNDIVTLKIVNPNGDLMTANPTDGTIFKDRKASDIENLEVKTSAKWKIGAYSLWVETKKEGASGLDESSNRKDLELLKGEINIEAEKTTAAEEECVKLIVTGVSNHLITIDSSEWGHTLFPAGLENNPLSTTKVLFSDKIDADGKRIYVVEFDDTGSYTIKVTDNSESPELKDTVDITVLEKEVTFDLPSLVMLGERLTIMGVANTGDWVAVAFDDVIPPGFEKLTIGDDKAFSKDINTGQGSESSKLKAPGSIRLKAFINYELPKGKSCPHDITTDEDEPLDDGSTAILLTTGELDAGLSTDGVATGDDFKVEGTLQGPREVEILTVAPKGVSGKGLRSAPGIGYMPDLYDTPPSYKVPKGSEYIGCTYDRTSVSETDYTFTKKLDVRDTADTGSYLVAVLSNGIDGEYGDNYGSSLPIALENKYGDISTKTQDQIKAMLDAMVNEAGSDDLMWTGYIKVATPMVTLEPIAGIAAGEPLVVKGNSNRKEGYVIVVTCKGGLDLQELTPATVAVTVEGTFEATLDTTGVMSGEYTVKADDGDGHTDDVKVMITGEGVKIVEKIIEEVEKELVDILETPAPTPTPKPTPEPTPEPTPKPPGFEAIFAIAGLLAVAYLVHRRKN